MKPYVTIKISDKYIAERLGLIPYFTADGYYIAQGYVNTYEKVKQNLQRYLDNATDNTVEITRSRRGEWGEWFERWELVNGKKKIIKQTWL
jgi:hypothetical protein